MSSTVVPLGISSNSLVSIILGEDHANVWPILDRIAHEAMTECPKVNKTGFCGADLDLDHNARTAAIGDIQEAGLLPRKN